MRQLKYFFLFVLLMSGSIACGQNNDRWRMTEDQAKALLDETLSDSTLHNFIGHKPLLIAQENAVEFAEKVLFDIYGKKNIQSQKPYDIFEFDGYWLISGTLPKEMKGGTFMIVLDSRDYRVVRLTHGK